MTGNMEYNAKIEEPNLSNSVRYENLTEEEVNSITTKILENKNLNQFITDIQEIILGYSDTDYDYDYEF